MTCIRVCFVALYAYPLFNGRVATPFGGSEVRAWMLARALSVEPNFDLHMVVKDHGQKSSERFGLVTVHPHPFYPASEKRPWFHHLVYETTAGATARRLWRRLPARHRLRRLMRSGAGKHGTILAPFTEEAGLPTGLTTLYDQVNADIYCTFGTNAVSAAITAYCRERGKTSVLFLGSDSDLSDHFRFLTDEVDQWGRLSHDGHAAIRNAHYIVAQTDWQRRRLHEDFGRDALVIANPIELNDGHDGPTLAIRPFDARDVDVLWVGKSDACKRPELCLDLARALPERRFYMVMSRSDPVRHRAVLRTHLPNVEITEYVPFAEVGKLFARARLCVSTSTLEGFPNTFLQAGKHGVPIASLVVDPDGFISRYGCGAVAGGDMGMLIADIRTLLDDKERWRKCAEASRAYVGAHHDLRIQAKRLHKSLLDWINADRTQKLNIGNY